MKKTYLLALVALFAGIAIIVSASQDVSTYATFPQAEQSGQKVKIAGELDKSQDVVYNPDEDPNVCSFHMIDSEGNKQKVLLKMPKPQDFELSESVVVSGKMNGKVFIADNALLKCPSKYKDEELQIRDELG